MIQRPFISSRYDRMKHTSQIPEETVNRFINESMKTKTMLEAKKKAKNFDYSNEGGAGKRERQEMEEPQGGKKESKWSKFKKAMNNAAGRVTSGDRFIRDTGMKMDHQEHEGELQNELSAGLARLAATRALAKQRAITDKGRATPESTRKGKQFDRFEAYSDAEYQKKGSGALARQTLKRRQNYRAPGSGQTFPPGSGEVAGARADAAKKAKRLNNHLGVQNSHQEHEGDLQNEVTKKRKKAQEELEQAARENKPTNRKLRRRFRGSGKARQLDIATTHGGRMPGESYSKKEGEQRADEGLKRDIRRGHVTRLPQGQGGWGHVQANTPRALYKQRFRQLRAMNPKMNQRKREIALGIAAAPGYMGDKSLASNARTDTAWVPNSRTPDSKIVAYGSPRRGRRRGETWDPSEKRPPDWGPSRQHLPAEKRKSLGEGSRGMKRLKRVADAKEKKYWKALEKGGPKDTSRNPNVTVDKREKEMNVATTKEVQKEKEGDARAVKNLSKTKNIKGALNLKGNKHRMDRRRSMHEEMTSTAQSARMRSKTPEGDYVKGGKQPGSKKARRKSDLKATLSKDEPTQKGVWKGGKKAAERERHVQSVAAHVRATGKAPRRRIPQSPEEEK